MVIAEDGAEKRGIGRGQEGKRDVQFQCAPWSYASDVGLDFVAVEWSSAPRSSAFFFGCAG